MKLCKATTADELLQMTLDEDVFEQILGMLEQSRLNNMTKLSKMRKAVLPKRMRGPSIKRRTTR